MYKVFTISNIIYCISHNVGYHTNLKTPCVATPQNPVNEDLIYNLKCVYNLL